ncbi:E3 ubiquitin-protein ligase MARCH1-like isoform X1 [Prunus avium]|uniref:E3 ubiquitin-protein ligase MARCH1-like isoform X1 n=1 Tax=Prunus avium TaxID=42229 RepID=A0A6P5REJ6_PRUAV|nr:E3 ubiquitin-protein ligase MARCH1-like isoform X1 [Prunus avium]
MFSTVSSSSSSSSSRYAKARELVGFMTEVRTRGDEHRSSERSMRSEKENENGEIPDLEKQQSDSGAEPSSLSNSAVGDTVPPLLNVVVLDEASREVHVQTTANLSREVPSPKKGDLSRTSSSHEQCRVCQQEKDEVLIDLGCQCRGGLAKSHRSCIDTWFRTRGSNKCEICQGVAANVPPPQSQPTVCTLYLLVQRVAFAMFINP